MTQRIRWKQRKLEATAQTNNAMQAVQKRGDWDRIILSVRIILTRLRVQALHQIKGSISQSLIFVLTNCIMPVPSPPNHRLGTAHVVSPLLSCYFSNMENHSFAGEGSWPCICLAIRGGIFRPKLLVSCMLVEACCPISSASALKSPGVHGVSFAGQSSARLMKSWLG